MEKSLVTKKDNSPAFVHNAMQSIEKAQEYSQMILDSKLAPAHFYGTKIGEKGRKETDYERTAAF